MLKPAHPKMTNQSPMYIYATEMVSDYYSRLDMKNKRVLSIIGSGDQIINAYYFGAKEVVGFDINKRAVFMLELKVSAIINLTYGEFIEFFGKDMRSGNLNYILYNKLKKDLSVKAQKFFDKIYEELNYQGRKLIKSDYFRQRSFIDSSAIDINIYLKNKTNYLMCKKLLKCVKLQSIEMDINDISADRKLKGKFDIINLSNVLNYLTGTTEENDSLRVLTETIKNIRKRVKAGGLFFYYSYSPEIYNSDNDRIPPASKLMVINKIKEANNFKVFFKKFSGISGKGIDRINIFTN